MADDSIVEPIVAAVQTGDLANAERLCRVALNRDPGATDVLLLLGLSLQRRGRDKDALPAYRRLTELRPDDGMHWGNYATALHRAGDVEAAEAAAAKAAELAPHDAERLEQLGMLRMQLGKLLDARNALLRAHAEAPDAAGISINAARACIACRDTRAGALLRGWRDWPQLTDGQRVQLADLLSQVGEIFDAIELLSEAVRRAPRDWAAQLLLAKTCERVNRVDEAEAVLRRIVAGGGAADPDVYREMARQNAQLAMRKHAYAAARVLLEQTGPANDSEYGYYFTLAKAADKLGDPDAAMRALEVAHTRQLDEIRSFAGYLFEPDTPVLLRAADRLREGAYRTWPQLRAPDTADSPVFVVGFPRSGTTLLEQMLDAHPGMQSMDERPFLNNLAGQLEDIGIQVPDDLYKLDQRDCDELRKGYVVLACGKIPRRWATRLVDKNPLNMLWLPMIHRMFPASKFILAVRHPCDVILSCYMQNFRAAPLAVASRSLDSLARAYVAAMENWLYHARLIRPDVFVSRYEDLVSDTAVQTRRIAAFLGLDDPEPMLRFKERAREKGFIATPSYTQVVEPINTRSVGHWRQYDQYFEPVLPILRPMLNHWGYREAALSAS